MPVCSAGLRQSAGEMARHETSQLYRLSSNENAENVGFRSLYLLKKRIFTVCFPMKFDQTVRARGRSFQALLI